MLTIDDQANRNMFASPVTRKPLSLLDGHLSTEDGSEKYRVSGGRAFFVNDGDMDSSTIMDRSYSSFDSTRERIRRVIRSTLFSVIRSRDAETAFASFRHVTNDKFVLGVGGGPTRDFDAVNLNIGPWKNVEIVADAHHLPYRNGSVANISCIAVLEHLKQPDTAVEEMVRVLAPGGYILVETPGLQPYHGFPNHFQNFTLTGHDLLIERFGIRKLSSGPSIGPTSALVALVAEYLRQYCPAGKVIGAAFKGTLGFLFGQLDRWLANHENAFVLAGASYFLGQKPEA